MQTTEKKESSLLLRIFCHSTRKEDSDRDQRNSSLSNGLIIEATWIIQVRYPRETLMMIIKRSLIVHRLQVSNRCID